ncbi:MAG: HNH endonuclease [Nitrososphaeraceae archaeon]
MTATNHPQILQLDVAGNPRQWINFERAAYYYAKDLVAWTMDNNKYTIYGGKNRKTTLQSYMDINTIIAVKGMGHNSSFKIPTLTNKALFLRDQNICAYCGGEFNFGNLTRDHIIPSSRGGKDIWTNVVAACGDCNRFKNDHLIEEIGMNLLYVPYTPNRHEYLILTNRKILADQMTYLMSGITKESRLLNPIKLN